MLFVATNLVTLVCLKRQTTCLESQCILNVSAHFLQLHAVCCDKEKREQKQDFDDVDAVDEEDHVMMRVKVKTIYFGERV